MAQATVTLKLTPKEFDVIRTELGQQVENLKELREISLRKETNSSDQIIEERQWQRDLAARMGAITDVLRSISSGQ